MTSTKKLIQRAFIRMYGFAPRLCEIVPLESSSNNGTIYILSFRVGKIGYTWCAGFGLAKDDRYDYTEAEA